MPKIPKSPSDRTRHNPLADEYVQPIRTKVSAKRKRDRDHSDDKNVEAHKILSLAKELEDEIDAEKPRQSAANTAFDFDDARAGESYEEPVHYEDDDNEWGEEEEEVEGVEIDPNDLATFHKFIPTDEDPIKWGEEAQSGNGDGGGTDLAALILEKIAAHEAANPAERETNGRGEPEDVVELPEKVVQVYSQVGMILSRYKSGKLPKPFKILPTIPAWETLITVTRPDSWTPNAVYAATRIFISSKPATAQIFLNSILLPRVQEDINETHRLNVHLYQALKKALYKPSCFFKGIVFPLLAEGCTQREATIVASVVTKVSVPVLHSAAALHRICEIAAEQMSLDPDSAGPANIFIKALLDKKYALPYKVVDSVVFHFLRFRATANSSDTMNVDNESDMGAAASGKLPVIFHQGLLAFAQRYRDEITEDQREALLDLLLTRGHKSISPEIRRELLAGRGRGVAAEPKPVGMDGDDTMVMAIDE